MGRNRHSFARDSGRTRAQVGGTLDLEGGGFNPTLMGGGTRLVRVAFARGD